MNYYCDIYSIKDGELNHKIAELKDSKTEDELEQVIYNEAFKKNKIFISVITNQVHNQLLVTKMTVILPPKLSTVNKYKTTNLIDSILHSDILNTARFFVLNFKNKDDNFDIEYHKLKGSNLPLIKKITEIYFNEKTGRLSDEEETLLKNYRTFNLRNILYEKSSSPIFNSNLGTIVITKDDNYYEMAETHAYHEKSAATVLAKHYQNNAYLKYNIDKIIALGDIVVVLNYLQVLVYRPPVITAFQTARLESLKKKILSLKSTYNEEVTSGAFIYTGQDILGIMEFLEDEKATASLTNAEVAEVIKETNELYYTPVPEASGMKR